MAIELDADIYMEVHSAPEKVSVSERHCILTTLILLDWFGHQDAYKKLVELFQTVPQEAYIHSQELMDTFPKSNAHEFGIPDIAFIRLHIPGKRREDCKEIWLPYFLRAFNALQMTDPQEQHTSYFSGLGSKQKFCIIAYEMDWNPSFVWHEYLHYFFPGFSDHTFFDEVMTEALAYERCGYFDRQTLQLANRDTLLAHSVDDVYYDHLQLFVDLARKIPGLFEAVYDAYTREGGHEKLQPIRELLGEELYRILQKTNPDEYNEALGAQQEWLSPAQASPLIDQISNLSLM